MRRVAARQPDKGNEQISQSLTLGCAAKDVQAVTDLHLLQLAEIAVELAERPVGRLVSDDAAITIESCCADEVDYLCRERLQPSWVAARRFVIFIDEALELGDAPITLGACQRRRQMIDDNGLRAALGLRPLTGIIDDEGVEMRQRAERRLGETFRRQRYRLARQPFEIAVLAHLDDGIGAEAISKPGVKGERRHQIGRMIARRWINVVTASRLQPDRDFTETEGGDGEITAIEPALAKERVALGRAPTCGHSVLHRRRQGGEEGGVIAARQAFLDRS